MPTFPLVRAIGEPYEVGWLHGRSMAQMIRVEFESRLGARDCHRSLRQASEIAPFLSEWAPHLLDEVKGVADGAGIDLRAALWMQWGMAVPGRKKDECTAFAVGPEYTGDGSVYAGQNKDTGVGANERSIVLCVHPAGFPSILSFSYPGLLAEIGLSSMGVSLWGMSLYVDGNRGGGNPMLKRMLLECGTVHEMRELATAIGGESVGAYAVSDADGNVGVMELLPERQVWIDGGRDSVGHANVIASPSCADRELDRHKMFCPSAQARHDRVNEALAEFRTDFSVEAGFEILADEKNHPMSICRETCAVDGIQTNAGVIAEPLAGRLHVTYGPPSNSSPRTTTLY